MISLYNVSKSTGGKILFSNVNCTVRPGDRIGLVGINGAGKTSLLKIICGEMSPDSGEISRKPDIKIGFLKQECQISSTVNLLEFVTSTSEYIKELKKEKERIEAYLEQENLHQDKAEKMARRLAEIMEQIEHLEGYDIEARAQKILAGLGFTSKWWDKPVNILSGGWIMRAEMARLLISNPDVLLLDEPTNHLDWASLLWLETFLKEFRGALIIVSHDREFLNRTVSRIWELDGGKFYDYTGNYDNYIKQRKQRIEHLKSAYRHQQERIKQIEEFIARNRVRKDRAKQVQSRIKMLEKMERIEPPIEEEKILNLEFPEPERCSRRVVELIGITKRYDDVPLYTNINLVVERTDKIAFIGVNGSGKTTLLKIIAGLVEPDEGKRLIGSNVKIGYYSQHRLETLNPDLTVFEEALSVSGNMPQTQLRQLLGAFRFSGDDVDKQVKVLSGGEKARLSICKLLLERPNLLLLDEPTNHLDIPSREVLEQALKTYKGAVCFISHDRRFINAIASKVLFFNDGKLEILHGNYDDFERIWRSRLDGSTTPKKPEHKRTRNHKLSSSQSEEAIRNRKNRKRMEAIWRNELYKLKKPILLEIEKIEARLDKAHERMDELKSLLSDPDTYKNGNRIKELQKEYSDLKTRIDELTFLWEEKSIELEELETNFWKSKQVEE